MDEQVTTDAVTTILSSYFIFDFYSFWMKKENRYSHNDRDTFLSIL